MMFLPSQISRVPPKRQPKRRATDGGDSAAVSTFFFASAESCSQAESTPVTAQVTQSVGRWLHKQYDKKDKPCGPPFSTQRRLGMLNDLEQADNLPDFPFENITSPLLIIHGTRDPFVPFNSARNLAIRAKKAQLLALENGGHLSFLIQHKQSKPAILDFVNKYAVSETMHKPIAI